MDCGDVAHHEDCCGIQPPIPSGPWQMLTPSISERRIPHHASGRHKDRSRAVDPHTAAESPRCVRRLRSLGTDGVGVSPIDESTRLRVCCCPDLRPEGRWTSWLDVHGTPRSGSCASCGRATSSRRPRSSRSCESRTAGSSACLPKPSLRRTRTACRAVPPWGITNRQRKKSPLTIVRVPSDFFRCTGHHRHSDAHVRDPTPQRYRSAHPQRPHRKPTTSSVARNGVPHARIELNSKEQATEVRIPLSPASHYV